MVKYTFCLSKQIPAIPERAGTGSSMNCEAIDAIIRFVIPACPESFLITAPYNCRNDSGQAGMTELFKVICETLRYRQVYMS